MVAIRIGREKAIIHRSPASEAAQPAGAIESEPLGSSTRLLELVQASLDDDKAEDVVAIDLNGKSTIADYMVIATGLSSRHVATMAEHLHEKLKKALGRPVSMEGVARADWILIDGGDVIVHVFRPEVRSFYRLEKMWGANLSRDRAAPASTPSSA